MLRKALTGIVWFGLLSVIAVGAVSASPSEQTETADTPYTGPLFDTHMHGWTYSPDSPEGLLKFLDPNQVLWAIFLDHYRSIDSSDLYTSRIEYVEATQSRVIHLDGRYSWQLFLPPDGTPPPDEDVLRQRLKPQGPYHGAGEIPSYWPETQDITYGSPKMQTIFRVVNEMGGTVMLHPRDTNWGSVQKPEDPTELEEAI